MVSTASRPETQCDGSMNACDRKVEKLAQAQFGFVTRTQCLEIGLSGTQIKTRVSAGGWTRYQRGVFLLPGIKVSTHGRLMAAQLWGGQESILCRSAAAWLHQIDDNPPSRPELYLRTGRQCEAVRCYRLASNDHPETARKHGMRLTRVERTLLDLCGTWEPRRVGAAMDAALRQGLTSIERLARYASDETRRGRAGSALFKQLVRGRDLRDGSVRSEFETRMLRVLKPIPQHHLVPNHPVCFGAAKFYLDFAYPALKLGIECQSIRWHWGDEAQKSDWARHRKLTLAGWTILPFCWDDVVFTPEDVRREVREAMTLRAATLFA